MNINRASDRGTSYDISFRFFYRVRLALVAHARLRAIFIYLHIYNLNTLSQRVYVRKFSCFSRNYDETTTEVVDIIARSSDARIENTSEVISDVVEQSHFPKQFQRESDLESDTTREIARGTKLGCSKKKITNILSNLSVKREERIVYYVANEACLVLHRLSFCYYPDNK